MTVPLAYARPFGRNSRRRMKLAGIIVCAAAAGVPGYRLLRPHFPQARYLYWQHQCMRYTVSPDFVVYEEDAVRSSAMLASGPPYQRVNSLGDPKAAGLDAQPAGYVPPPLSRLGTKWVCIAYLHACRLPDGEQRLGVLGIQVFQRGPDGGRVLELYGTGKTPASWQPGSTVQGSAGRKASIPLLPRHRFRLYAGQPNPQDGSRFTMRYELDGRGGTIEGRLAPDGTIDCTVIDGPCTVVSP